MESFFANTPYKKPGEMKMNKVGNNEKNSPNKTHTMTYTSFNSTRGCGEMRESLGGGGGSGRGWKTEFAFSRIHQPLAVALALNFVPIFLGLAFLRVAFFPYLSSLLAVSLSLSVILCVLFMHPQRHSCFLPPFLLICCSFIIILCVLMFNIMLSSSDWMCEYVRC